MPQYNAPTGDFVTSTLNGALTAGATSATIGTGLTIPAANGLLQLDYNSVTAVGSDNGPETISYTSYTSGTGALSGVTRGLAGTTGVAHANGATVSCSMSSDHFGNGLIVNADLSTATGEIGAAWQTYTPTVTGITGGTMTASYIKIGKVVHFQIRYILAGGNVPTASPTFTLPVTASSFWKTSQGAVIGQVNFVDAGTADYVGAVRTNSTTVVGVLVTGTNGLTAGVSSTVPFTWVNTDEFELIGTYESA